MKKEIKKTFDITVYFSVIALLILGFVLRYNGIDKPDGLWYDELLSYSLSKESFPFGIVETVTKNEFQGIFHYLYLGLWMIFFGDGDIVLRFSSLVWGVFLIPLMYFLGKELYSKGLGIFLAIIVSLNPLLIYYSQEVRPYSLLAFSGALSLLFMLRSQRNPNRLNLLTLAAANLLVLYTYTIGFVFVALQAVFIVLFSFYRHRSALKSFIASYSLVLLGYLPYAISVANNIFTYKNSVFIEPFFYTSLNVFSPLITLFDWFTPMLNGIYQHNETMFREIFFNTQAAFTVFVFFLFVSLLFILGIINSLREINNRIYSVFIPCFGFLLFEVIGSLNGIFCFVSRHTLLVLPGILLLSYYGLFRLLRGRYLVVFSVFICGVCLLGHVTSNSVAKWTRPGIVPAINVLDKYNLGKDDIVVSPCFNEFIKKYMSEVSTINIDYMNAALLDKSKHSLKLFIDGDLAKNTNRNNSHKNLEKYLKGEDPQGELLDLIGERISNLEKGRYFVVIRKTDYARYNQEELEGLLEDQQNYENEPVFYMFASKIVSDILKTASMQLELIEKYEIDPIWEVHVFQKI